MSSNLDARRDAPPPDILQTLRASRSKTRAGRLLGAILLFFAVALVGFAFYLSVAKDTATAPRYLTVPARRGDLHVAITATGALKALNTVDVGAEISGRVLRVHVDFNDAVTKGQVLAEISTDGLQAEVAEATARVASAAAALREARASENESKKHFARLQKLAAEGLSSQQDLDTAQAAAERGRASVASAQAGLTVAQASLAAAQANLKKAVIISPMDGIVLNRSIEPGQAVAAAFQTPVLFTIAEDLSKMALHADIDEADVGRVRAGQEASFTVDAYPGQSFSASVAALHHIPKTGQSVVTYEAVLRVDNPERMLRPGMTATATIVTNSRKDVLLVPNAALRYTPQPPRGDAPPDWGMQKRGSEVWTPGDGDPVPIAVVTGGTDGQLTEIVSGQVTVGMPLITGALDPAE